jgi:hypothetical protein
LQRRSSRIGEYIVIRVIISWARRAYYDSEDVDEKIIHVWRVRFG